MRSRVPVVLLQPPGACRTFTRSASIYPPLGLCQLAAVAGAGLAEVLDADAAGWSDDQTLREVLARRPALVGFTATSFTLELVDRYARPLRDAGIRVIVGGPHPTLAPLDALSKVPSADFIFRGEAEPVFRLLCERAAAGASLYDLPGVVERGAMPSGEPLRVESIDELPWPVFAGLPIAAYRCPDAVLAPLVTMMTARGCPHHCAYCSSPTLSGRKLRAFSASSVVDEIQRLQEVHGVREISFVDDVFSLPRGRAFAICHEINARGVRLSWFCNARADQIDAPLSEAMARAGCHQVYLGFESGSQRILDAVGKGATVAQLERGAQFLKDAGIHRSVGFVVGLPGEDDASVNESIALAQRVRPERIQFTGLTVLPGTPLADRMPITALGRTFHSRHDDQIGRWQAAMYEACGTADGWGKASL